jgi:hypothetical protein
MGKNTITRNRFRGQKFCYMWRDASQNNLNTTAKIPKFYFSCKLCLPQCPFILEKHKGTAKMIQDAQKVARTSNATCVDGTLCVTVLIYFVSDVLAVRVTLRVIS